MRGLAEFVMRGRTQALLVVCISAGTVLLFWIGAAALALVTLRRGVSEGLQLLMWGLLPALAVLFYGNEFAPLAALLGSFVTAVVLRRTVSWPASLVVATLCGVVTGLVLLGFAGDFLAMIKVALEEFIERLVLESGESLQLTVPGVAFIAGVFGLINAVTVTVCVILGRYWQASLYNPGGFREEFHRIRLAPTVALPLVLISMACLMMGVEWLPWAYLATVPCLLAGISLVHGIVGLKQWKNYWLVLFYILLVLVNPVKELVIVAAVVDSWMNFRQRLGGSTS